MVRNTSVFLLFLLPIFGWTQTPPTTQEVLRALKEDTRFEDGGADWVQFSELLLSLADQPVSLNSASKEELQLLPLLNKFQIHYLLMYRRQSGGIVSYYELTNVEGFTPELIKWIMPFTTLEKKRTPIKINQLLNGRHQIALRYQRLLQQKAGYTSNKPFTGDANALYLRYRYSYYNKVFAGFTLQKDAGEPYLIPQKVYPDYSSYHIELRELGRIKSLIIGDFQANYGQGLTLWTTNTFGKTAETTSGQRFGKGVRYYSGADENRFLRGVAASIQFNKQITIDMFASKNRVDATVSNGFATSLTESGLHRNLNEIEKRKIQRISSLGGHVSWEQNSFEIGATVQYYQFLIPIAEKNEPYAVHQFSGDRNYITGLDYQWIIKNTILYGEVSRSKNGGVASITGFKAKATDAITFNGMFRSIDKNYHALYNAPFAESDQSGEKGVYLGIHYAMNSRLTLKGYADWYSFSWLRFQTSAPRNGKDYLIQLDYKKANRFVYVRYRYKNGSLNLSEGVTPEIHLAQQHLFRIHAKVFLTPTLKSNTRLEIRKHHFSENFTGYLFYQEFVAPIKPDGLKLYFRLSYFNSPDFRTTLYAREDDLPYTYNLAQFNGEGLRYYLMLRYQWKKVNLYLRWAHTRFVNQQSIGSGNDLIEGNYRSEIKAMLALRL